MKDVAALQAADAVLALINAQPRTPTREQLAAAIAAHAQAPAGNLLALSPEGDAFSQAAEWEIACVRSTRRLGDKASDDSFDAHQRVNDAAARVWACPAATFADVVAHMLVAAHFRAPIEGPYMTICHDGGRSDAVDNLLAAIERVSGVTRCGKVGSAASAMSSASDGAELES